MEYFKIVRVVNNIMYANGAAPLAAVIMCRVYNRRGEFTQNVAIQFNYVRRVKIPASFIFSTFFSSSAVAATTSPDSEKCTIALKKLLEIPHRFVKKSSDYTNLQDISLIEFFLLTTEHTNIIKEFDKTHRCVVDEFSNDFRAFFIQNGIDIGESTRSFSKIEKLLKLTFDNGHYRVYTHSPCLPPPQKQQHQHRPKPKKMTTYLCILERVFDHFLSLLLLVVSTT